MMRNKTDNERRVARRNMIAGVLAGVIVATVAGAYAQTTYKKMVKGTPATAADVNQAHQDLADAIDKLQAEITKLKSDPDCPPGYTRSTTPTSITLCQKGKDEMVKVGSFWIDRYEASLVDSKTWNGGKCEGTGGKCGTSSTGQCGAGANDDYPPSFPDSGNWTSTRIYACSISGNMPSRKMTWFQAQQACLLAGKRLCTNGEWQGAAAGTSDPGKHNGAKGGKCNTDDIAPRKTGQAGKIGNSAICISSWGAEDMIGNLWEWVDLWGRAGGPWQGTTFVDGKKTYPWPASYGDGGDGTWNIGGRVRNVGWVNGAPAAARRGGAFDGGSEAGSFTMALDLGPAYHDAKFGARCCR